jgi:hypothetical protein
MRLILTILVRIVPAVLLLIAVVVVILRIRDRNRRMDHFEYATGGRMVYVHSRDGRLSIMVARPWPKDRSLSWLSGVGNEWDRNNTSGISMLTRDSAWRRFGIAGVSGRGYALGPGGQEAVPGAPSLDFALYIMPHWIVATACAVPPLAWLALVVPKRIRQRRRTRLGLCLGCGYDLRESPGRCPECGSVPAPTVPS